MEGTALARHGERQQVQCVEAKTLIDEMCVMLMRLLMVHAVIVYFVAAASGGASHDLRATSCESGGSRTEVDARRWLDGN